MEGVCCACVRGQRREKVRRLRVDVCCDFCVGRGGLSDGDVLGEKIEIV